MNTQEKIADIQRQLDEVKREIEAPKQIDWSSVKAGTLVRAWDSIRGKHIRVYKKYRPGEVLPHECGDCRWMHASLETGQWVFNHSGENPWPNGVLVEVVYREHQADIEERAPASDFIWILSGDGDDIIASRCVGLEEGWRW